MIRGTIRLKFFNKILPHGIRINAMLVFLSSWNAKCVNSIVYEIPKVKTEGIYIFNLKFGDRKGYFKVKIKSAHHAIYSNYWMVQKKHK